MLLHTTTQLHVYLTVQPGGMQTGGVCRTATKQQQAIFQNVSCGTGVIIVAPFVQHHAQHHAQQPN